MQAPSVYSNAQFSLQAITVCEVPYFRAADVARQLGYTNCSQAIRKNVRSKFVTSLAALLEQLRSPAERGVSPGDIPSGADLYLAEPGLYALVLKSRQAEAEVFNDWICEEVLPQIRSTGAFASRRPQTKLQLQLMTETDLHAKVVDFIRTFHPKALLIAGLGELQDTPPKRIDAWRKGYTKGQPDLLIANRSGRWSGLALEFKTPACTGSASPEQTKCLQRLADAGWKTLLSNSYDEICNEIRDYFRNVRVACRLCGLWVKPCNLQPHLLGHEAAPDEEKCEPAE